jgi:phosphopantothenoylcysteine decarboxylase / phosphopantothenate---cysteine ligase
MQSDILIGKKIIVGVSGGIAAYKACYLVREFVKRGAQVKVVMTPSACQFVAPLTFSSLSGNDVIVNVLPESQQDGSSVRTWHIDMALWADLMVIAPATVNTIAKMAGGFADNALTILVLALRCPLILAPAADVDMYENKFSKENIKKLESAGMFIVEAETGDLASGLQGKGRLADIYKIIDAAEIVLAGEKKDLSGRKVLVTAGPTFEDIDPVRFIGNRSSGKMGYAVAKAASLRGAEVTLISGPSSESIYPEIKVLKVRSGCEMKEAVEDEIQKNDILIMSAAVADYRPSERYSKKVKKEEGLKKIELTENEDILGSVNKEGKIVVGFALETDDEKVNAATKLKKKQLDMIVLNSLKDEGSGFEHDTNKITIIHKNGDIKEQALATKFRAANIILTEIIKIPGK